MRLDCFVSYVVSYLSFIFYLTVLYQLCYTILMVNKDIYVSRTESARDEQRQTDTQTRDDGI